MSTSDDGAELFNEESGSVGIKEAVMVGCGRPFDQIEAKAKASGCESESESGATEK